MVAVAVSVYCVTGPMLCELWNSGLKISFLASLINQSVRTRVNC